MNKLRMMRITRPMSKIKEFKNYRCAKFGFITRREYPKIIELLGYPRYLVSRKYNLHARGRFRRKVPVREHAHPYFGF